MAIEIRCLLPFICVWWVAPRYCASEKFTGTSAREATGRPATRAGSKVQRWTPCTAALSSAGNPWPPVVGNPSCFRHHLCNVGERRVEEQTAELRESEQRFRSLSAASPIGVFEADVLGNCVYTNSRWQEITRLTDAQSRGDGYIQAIHPDDRASIADAWRSTVAEGRDYAHEGRILTPMGEVRWVSVRARARVA